ncbi:MAG: hypothetical protein AAFQ80_12480 [Cyanobacteria bacterium J06621_8]
MEGKWKLEAVLTETQPYVSKKGDRLGRKAITQRLMRSLFS